MSHAGRMGSEFIPLRQPRKDGSGHSRLPLTVILVLLLTWHGAMERVWLLTKHHFSGSSVWGGHSRYPVSPTPRCTSWGSIPCPTASGNGIVEKEGGKGEGRRGEGRSVGGGGERKGRWDEGWRGGRGGRMRDGRRGRGGGMRDGGEGGEVG